MFIRIEIFSSEDAEDFERVSRVIKSFDIKCNEQIHIIKKPIRRSSGFISNGNRYEYKITVSLKDYFKARRIMKTKITATS